MFQHIDAICSCEGKFCPDCAQWKCHLAFYKNPKGVKGLFSRCKICTSIHQKAYYERKKAEALQSVEIPVFQHLDDHCNCDGKFCRRCCQWKCHGAFSKDRKGSKGLSSQCKECIRSYQQAHLDRINERRRENRKENADHYNTYNKEYHRKNPEPKKARDREYRLANKESINAYMMNYTKGVYKEKRRERDREYRRLYPEKSAQYFHKRRARLQQAEGSFTSKEWKRLCKHYNYTCLCCGKCEPEIKLTIDHVIPLSKGGANSIENIQPLCQSCNSTKARATTDYRVNWP